MNYYETVVSHVWPSKQWHCQWPLVAVQSHFSNF